MDSLTPRATRFFVLDGYFLNKNIDTFQEEAFQGHFSRSQAAIVEAIDGLRGTALIFGAGGLNDIPALQLARQFERVILVDVNLEYTKIALARLPENVQGKFTLEEADLSGIFGELSTIAEKIVQEKPTHDEFISKILSALPTIKRKEFDCPGVRPSFICSSLLTSQLSVNAHKYLNDLSQELYSKPFLVPPGEKEKYDYWRAQIQTSHIDELHRLADEKCRVYFADHFSAKSVRRLTSATENQRTVRAETRFSEAQQVQTRLDERFSVLNKKSWTWILPLVKMPIMKPFTEPDGLKRLVPVTMQDEREYDITALTLQSK